MTLVSVYNCTRRTGAYFHHAKFSKFLNRDKRIPNSTQNHDTIFDLSTHKEGVVSRQLRTREIYENRESLDGK